MVFLGWRFLLFFFLLRNLFLRGRWRRTFLNFVLSDGSFLLHRKRIGLNGSDSFGGRWGWRNFGFFLGLDRSFFDGFGLDFGFFIVAPHWFHVGWILLFFFLLLF